MQLHYAQGSPFVRKVMACAILRGIDGMIAIVPTDPHHSPAHLLAANPLSKIPCLLLDDGTAVFDSPVICEYLDTIGDAAPLFPPTGSAARLAAQTRHALADGMMDAAVVRRGQAALPQDEGRAAFVARQKAAVARGLAVLEAAPPTGLADIGEVAVACALGYLDYRYAQEPWREAQPKLAAWFAAVSQQPALARTPPPG
jgi:glutathione S-transferase